MPVKACTIQAISGNEPNIGQKIKIIRAPQSSTMFGSGFYIYRGCISAG
ncbi:hypothetical protein RintRC_1338 [Richelia intracellularis]|nr:hypothetical protein RintRC_1338 [Richelia intracellularis]